jgi:hypothetical protein
MGVFEMIGWILRFLFTPWGLVVLGALIMNGAGILIAVSQTEVPERAALSQVAGVLDRVVKVTRGRTHRVTYNLEIKSANGELVKLTLPEHDISEEQVRDLLGRPIVALFSGTEDVWELSTGATRIIQYEQMREQRIEMQAFEAQAAPYLGGGGLLVSLIGVLRLFRRRRTAAAA